MENNVNNNIASSNPEVSSNGGVNTSNAGVATNTVNNGVNPATVSQSTVINPTPVNSTIVNQAVSQPVNPSQVAPTTINQPVNTATTVNNITSNNGGQKSYKKFYIWMGIIVGIVLIVASVLLYFLLNGSIQNRNRLTCNKVTQESDYEYSVQRYYIFDDGIMQRVNLTYTFEYNNELTDLRYNQDFDDVINNETYGSTKYGFATNIKKEGNVVTITAYQPSYWGESLDKVKETNKEEGYTCK